MQKRQTENVHDGLVDMYETETKYTANELKTVSQTTETIQLD